MTPNIGKTIDTSAAPGARVFASSRPFGRRGVIAIPRLDKPDRLAPPRKTVEAELSPVRAIVNED